MGLSPDIQLRLVETPQDVEEFFRWLGQRREVLGFDTETEGLSFSHNGLRTVQFGDLTAGWCIPTEWWKGVVREVFDNYQGDYVAQNAPFDILFLRQDGIHVPTARVHDTRPMGHLIDPTRPTGLKPMAERYIDSRAGHGQRELNDAMAKYRWTWKTVPIDFPAYWCVPQGTEILTKTGWKKHSEVVPGDQTLGYKDGKAEWTIVQKVQTFDDAPLVRLGNKYWGTECTPNHRWIMRKGVSETVKVLPLNEGWKDKGTTKLITAAPAVGGASVLTAGEASVLAWLLSDGSIYWQRPETQTSPIATITQSPKKFADEIRNLLEDEGAYVSEKLQKESGCIKFYVSAPYVQKVWDKANLRENSITGLVLTLSQEARKAWFLVWYLAEGEAKNSKNVITQNFGDKLDALALCAFLEGYTPHTRAKTEKCGYIRFSSREMTPQKTKVTDAGRGAVWCPVTDLGTWTARDREGNIFLTGNTYAALDPVITAALYEHLYPQIQSGGFQGAYDLEIASQQVLTEMEWRGIRCDLGYTERTATGYGEHIARLRQWVTDVYGIKNPTANAQVMKRLQEDGVQFIQLTPKGKVKMTEDVLEELDHPLAKAVIEIRKYTKLKHSYLDNFIGMADSDGFLHPQINPLGARTGRMSITNPALQTLTRGREIRDAFIPREGNEFLIYDYDQIELRLMAHFSGDENMIKAIKDGLDLHTYTASLVYGVSMDEVLKEQRSLAKNAGFARIYGAGIAKFASTAGCDIETAQYFFANYAIQFPGVDQFIRRIQYTVQDRARASEDGQGWVTEPYGRRHPVSADEAYKATNYLIQGTAASFLKRKLVDLDLAGVAQYAVLPVHDEILFDVPLDLIDDVERVVQDTMPDRLNFAVNLDCSGERYDRWGAKYS